MPTSIPFGVTYQYGQISRTGRYATFHYPPPDYKQEIKGWKSINSSDKTQMSTTYISKTTTVTPGFHKIVKSGGFLPCNPFSYSKVTVFNEAGTIEERSYSQHRLIDDRLTSGQFGPTYFYISNVMGWPSQRQLDALDNEAITKIRLALKQQHVNIAQIIAERNKTATSIAKIASTIAAMLLSVKKGDVTGAMRHAGKHVGWRKARSNSRDQRSNPERAAANAWLELQYAIKPLLMDAQGLAEALAKQQYRPIRGKVEASKTLNLNETSEVTVPGGWYSTTIKNKLSGSIKIKYVVMYQVDSPEMPDLAGLGLTNPAQLAWELVPFSFVVDWFLPIGNWLSSLDATVGLSFADGSKSIKKDYTFSRHRIYHEDGRVNGTGLVVHRDSKVSLVEDSVERTKLINFPPVSLPEFKNPASLMHLASSIALLSKAVSGMRR